MGSVSFRVPDEMKERMEARDEVNWSAVLRGYIEKSYTNWNRGTWPTRLRPASV
jgi:predicted DNA-binding protein